jgi:hypothetical protein
MFSEATKILKAEYLVKAIRQHRMDQAIIFCRTKLDCDNIENYLLTLGGGLCLILLIYLLEVCKSDPIGFVRISEQKYTFRIGSD